MAECRMSLQDLWNIKQRKSLLYPDSGIAWFLNVGYADKYPAVSQNFKAN
jgi:hypothetical protein